MRMAKREFFFMIRTFSRLFLVYFGAKLHHLFRETNKRCHLSLQIGLKIDDIVLFLVVGIKKSNSDVVQIHADNGRKRAEPLSASTEVVHDEHGLLTVVEEKFVIGAFQKAEIHLSLGKLLHQGSPQASGMEIFGGKRVGSASCHDVLGLPPVGAAKQQMENLPYPKPLS